MTEPRFRPSRETIGERSRTHGHFIGRKQSPTYRCWRAMLTRCTNPRAPQSKRYAKKGVTVCRRWRKFENFLVDMGERPTLKHSLDRFPDCAGNYKPTNVRWATPRQQRLNRSTNRAVIRSDGARFGSFVEAAESVGGQRQRVRYCCLNGRGSYKGFSWRLAR